MVERSATKRSDRTRRRKTTNPERQEITTRNSLRSLLGRANEAVKHYGTEFVTRQNVNDALEGSDTMQYNRQTTLARYAQLRRENHLLAGAVGSRSRKIETNLPYYTGVCGFDRKKRFFQFRTRKGVHVPRMNTNTLRFNGLTRGVVGMYVYQRSFHNAKKEKNSIF